jgi:dsDNA-specific endonuclease/ATPase MutS2
MNRLNIVTIIHGKGTGALRQAVSQSLKRKQPGSNPSAWAVTGKRDGCTIVELK